MDPEANLREQEAILTERAQGGRVDAARLRELREALVGWLRGGGFAPTWARAPLAAKYYQRQHVACPWCPGFDPRDRRNAGISHIICAACKVRLRETGGLTTP